MSREHRNSLRHSLHASKQFISQFSNRHSPFIIEEDCSSYSDSANVNKKKLMRPNHHREHQQQKHQRQKQKPQAPPANFVKPMKSLKKIKLEKPCHHRPSRFHYRSEELPTVSEEWSASSYNEKSMKYLFCQWLKELLHANSIEKASKAVQVKRSAFSNSPQRFKHLKDQSSETNARNCSAFSSPHWSSSDDKHKHTSKKPIKMEHPDVGKTTKSGIPFVSAKDKEINQRITNYEKPSSNCKQELPSESTAINVSNAFMSDQSRISESQCKDKALNDVKKFLSDTRKYCLGDVQSDSPPHVAMPLQPPLSSSALLKCVQKFLPNGEGPIARTEYVPELIPLAEIDNCGEGTLQPCSATITTTATATAAKNHYKVNNNRHPIAATKEFTRLSDRNKRHFASSASSSPPSPSITTTTTTAPAAAAVTKLPSPPPLQLPSKTLPPRSAADSNSILPGGSYSVVKKFKLMDYPKVQSLIKDSQDRRLKAITDRFNCQLSVYEILRQNSCKDLIMILQANTEKDLIRCVHCIDRTFKWHLYGQLQKQK